MMHVVRNLRTRSAPSSRPIRRTRPLAVEPLDVKELPSAVTASLGADHVLRVYGTDQPDVIQVCEQGGNLAVVSSTGGYPNAPVGTLPVSSVGRIEIYGGAGNDYIRFYKSTYGGLNWSLDLKDSAVPVMMSGDDGADVLVSDFTGPGADYYPTPVTMTGGAGADQLLGGHGNDSLVGGDGNDTLRGQGGNDVLSGSNDDDQLWGGTGFDTLYGGAGNDWLDAGSANEIANGGGQLLDFNAYVTTYAGTSITDIRQGGGNTCWVMSSLAAATYRGIDLPSRIQYLGDGTYRVNWRWYDSRFQMFEDVKFVGDVNVVDAQPQSPGESWPLLYQRAILQGYYFSLTNPPGGNPAFPMSLLTGRSTVQYDGTDLTNLKNALANGKLVTALTNQNPANVYGNLTPWHVYMVENLRIDSYSYAWVGSMIIAEPNYVVTLYDPNNPGSPVTVSWGDFARTMVEIDAN